MVSVISSMGDSSIESSLGGAALLSLVSPTPLCPDSFINLFGKGVLMAKQLPPFHLIVSLSMINLPSNWILQTASSSYLKHVTLAKFNEIVLPQVKKALLRSPEVAVYGKSDEI